jgi:hypothetical protein
MARFFLERIKPAVKKINKIKKNVGLPFPTGPEGRE